MFIDSINTREEFNKLRENWERLYERDPEAQFYLSWEFLSTYMRRYEGAWFILAVRSGPRGSPYIALMPMRLRTRLNKKTGRFHNEINMAGNRAADYAGVICAPEYAKRALTVLGKHLKKMNWAKLHLENLRMSQKRLVALVDQFKEPRFTIREIPNINKKDNINHSLCPSIDLPDSWEKYLEKNVGSSTRQKIRRFLRKVENSVEFRITHADASTIQRDVDVLLGLWRTKWAVRKGDLLPGLLRSNRVMYRDAWQSGTLFLPVLWHGDKPLGALAMFIDETKKSMLFYMAGRDETSDVIPSGLVLHAHCIRLAIERGFKTYDFMRGNEPYKYSFGATDTPIYYPLIQTRTGRNLGELLDDRSIESAYKQATKFHETGERTKAEVGYRQIVATAPSHGRTLYGLGQILAEKGDYWEAAKTFEALVAIAPSSVKAWSRLALALQALNRHLDAVGAFRKALELKPGFPLAQDGLGRSLVELKLNDARGRFSVLQERAGGSSTLALSAIARTQPSNQEPVYILKNPAIKDPTKPSPLPVPEVGMVGAVQRIMASQSQT